MARYRQVYFGQWYRVPWRNYKVAGCDCGLVHVLDHRRGRNGELFVRYNGDRKRTALIRRKPQAFVRRRG